MKSLKTKIITILSCLVMSQISFSKDCNIDNVIDVASKQVDYQISEMKGKVLNPRTILPNGKTKYVQFGDWTSGFFPATLWYLYELSGNDKYLELAKIHTKNIEKAKTVKYHHDVGFMVECSFGNGLRLTNDKAYKDAIITAANSLSTRFRKNAGIIQSWGANKSKGWYCPVIIDNMMNLELLYNAYNLSGNEKYKDIALSHANTTLKNHFREDGSVNHLLEYDAKNGDVKFKRTVQGYADDSTWSRGHAWAIYGFTMMYRFTKDKRYLNQALKTFEYMKNHKNSPKDLIPYWDMDAPNIPNEPRDASAAAIIASALYEISTYKENSNYYKDYADEIVNSLSSEKYLAKDNGNNGFILMHSTGHKMGNIEIDVPLNYADYYFLEALKRKRDLESKCLTLQKQNIIKKDGAWCWYQDERLLADGDNVFFGSVSKIGNIDISSWNVKTGDVKTITIDEKFNSDDHAAPAFLRLEDGKMLLMWSSHHNAKKRFENNKVFYTVSENPADISKWGEIKTLQHFGCYNHIMKSDNKIYDFFRKKMNEDGSSKKFEFVAQYIVSDDNGKTFKEGGNFVNFPFKKGDSKITGLDGVRSYPKYIGNGKDTMHFVMTESHPLAYDNSVYHGYVKNEKVYKSDGTFVGDMPKGKEPALLLTKFTKIFDGDADNSAWTTDIHLDENGNPVILFTVQKDGASHRKIRDFDSQDIRYHYARYINNEWVVNEMAYGGSCLYPNQSDYSGICAINPNDVNTVFISTNVNPSTNKPLISSADKKRHWEIFKGVTCNNGKTWEWTAITSNSTVDNLRPMIPVLPKTYTGNKLPVLWLAGKYWTYKKYDLNVVGYLDNL